MTPNRRNYYRILQVQPEAPPEVIKASWRALMHAGRAHPDLGGDPAAATLLNEAYAVLGDPERRRDYDRQLDLAQRHSTARSGSADPGPRGTARRIDPALWRSERCCPMCHAPLPAAPRIDSRCVRCDAPLAPAPTAASSARELLGRRSAVRRPRSDTGALLTDWRGVPIEARLIDLSLGGASLFAGAAVSPGTAVRVLTDSIDGVARVVACHRSQAQWRVRVQWLTARPLAGKGVWVRASA